MNTPINLKMSLLGVLAPMLVICGASGTARAAFVDANCGDTTTSGPVVNNVAGLWYASMQLTWTATDGNPQSINVSVSGGGSSNAVIGTLYRLGVRADTKVNFSCTRSDPRYSGYVAFAFGGRLDFLSTSSFSNNCFVRPFGTLFQDFSGLSDDLIIAASNGTDVNLRLTYVPASGSPASADLAPSTSTGYSFSFGGNSQVTYSCPNEGGTHPYFYTNISAR